MTAKTVPLFLGVCHDCGRNVRYINERPHDHHCQHNIESREATPWKA